MEGLNDNGQGIQNQLEGDFANLWNEVSQGDAPANELPEKIGELPIGDFEQLLGQATNGVIGNYNQFQEALSARDKLGELNEKLARLQVQNQELSGGPKYANDLVAKIDEMYRGGVPQQQINEFIRMQNVDVANMSDVEIVKMAYKQDYPNMTSEEIEQLLEEDFGDLEGMGGIKLKKEAVNARKKLEQLKVDLAEPEHIRQQKAKQSEMDATFRNWSTLLGRMYENKQVQAFDVQLGDNQHSIEFNIPDEFRPLLAQELAKYATTQNIPVTNKGLEQLQDFAERSIMFKYGKDILAKVIRDISAETKSGELRRLHNVEPISRGEQKTHVKKELTGLEKTRSKMTQYYMRK